MVEDKDVIHVPSLKQVLKIIEAAYSLRDKLIIKVLATTGLRNFELIELKISDFDFLNMRMTNKVR